MKYTQNYNLKKPEGTDVVNIEDLNANADIIDMELSKRIVNAGGVPSIQAGIDANKPAPGMDGRLYVATDTKIIYRDDGTAWQKVGVVNWADIDGKPSSFPPSAHTHSGSDITSKVASASTADSVDWSGITNKPTSFTPSPHKSTHAINGSDPITPADIGAVSKAGDTMTGDLTVPSVKIGAGGHLYGGYNPNGANPYIVKDHNNGNVTINARGGTLYLGYYNTTDILATASGYKVWHAGNQGSGSGMNADMVDGLHASDLKTAHVITLLAADPPVSTNSLGDTIIRPTYFLFNSVYSNSRQVYFEVVGYSQSGSLAQFILYNETTSSNIVTLSTTSQSTIRIRSAAISIPDGHTITVHMKSDGSNWIYLFRASLIII